MIDHAKFCEDILSRHRDQPLVRCPGDPDCICSPCVAARIILKQDALINELEGPPCSECGHNQDSHAHVESCRVVECDCWAYMRRKDADS